MTKSLMGAYLITNLSGKPVKVLSPHGELYVLPNNNLIIDSEDTYHVEYSEEVYFCMLSEKMEVEI